MTGEEAYWAGLDQDQEKETDALLPVRRRLTEFDYAGLSGYERTICARCGQIRLFHEPGMVSAMDHEFTLVWKPWENVEPVE